MGPGEVVVPALLLQEGGRGFETGAVRAERIPEVAVRVAAVPVLAGVVERRGELGEKMRRLPVVEQPEDQCAKRQEDDQRLAPPPAAMALRVVDSDVRAMSNMTASCSNDLVASFAR